MAEKKDSKTKAKNVTDKVKTAKPRKKPDDSWRNQADFDGTNPATGKRWTRKDAAEDVLNYGEGYMPIPKKGPMYSEGDKKFMENSGGMTKDGYSLRPGKGFEALREKRTNESFNPPSKTANEEKLFKEGFEDPMNDRVKAGKFKPQGMGPRKSWEGPDKIVAPSPVGKAGPLPRSPSSVGLPKIPRAPSSVGLPPVPKKYPPMNLPQARPGISREVYQTDASTPPMRIPGKPPVGVMPPAPTAPAPDYLDVFRQPKPSVTQQSSPQPPNSMMGAGMGASGLGATMDNAWNPNAASDRYNEASDANRASQNMEKNAWFNSMTPEQQAEHLRMFRNR